MIFEMILYSISSFLISCFSWIDIPSISDYGTSFNDALGLIGDILVSAQSLIDLFLPWDIVRFGFPILILVISFEYLYNFVMWIVKKVPMLGVE